MLEGYNTVYRGLYLHYKCRSNEIDGLSGEIAAKYFAIIEIIMLVAITCLTFWIPFI